MSLKVLFEEPWILKGLMSSVEAQSPKIGDSHELRIGCNWRASWICGKIHPLSSPSSSSSSSASASSAMSSHRRHMNLIQSKHSIRQQLAIGWQNRFLWKNNFDGKTIFRRQWGKMFYCRKTSQQLAQTCAFEWLHGALRHIYLKQGIKMSLKNTVCA